MTFDPSTFPEFTLRSQQQGAEGASPPSGIAFLSNGDCLISDDFNHQIQIYGNDGVLKKTFGGQGAEPGQFKYPKGIAVDAEDRIYVADCWNHRIQVFDADGNSLQHFGNYGDGPAELNEPYHLSFDSEGRLVVVERCNHRLQFFSVEGQSLGILGSRGSVVEEKLAHLYHTHPRLLPPPLFEFPTSIAQDSVGNFYISDSGNHRIQKFDSQWNRIDAFGEWGENGFQYAMWVAVGPGDLLYVADMNNNRIQALSSTGVFLGAITHIGKSKTMEGPVVIAAHGNQLWVGLAFQPELYVYPLPDENSLEQKAADPRHLDWQGQRYEESNDDARAYECYKQAAQLAFDRKAEPQTLTFKIALLNRMARTANSQAPETCGPLLAQHLVSCREDLNRSRQELMRLFADWDKILPEWIKANVEEQNRLLSDQEEDYRFNKPFYELEAKERKLFRESRSRTSAYRLHCEQYAEYLQSLLDLPLTDQDRNDCLKSLESDGNSLCQLIGSYLDAKEKNEEAMLNDFSAMQESPDQWSAFVSKLDFSRRILNLCSHLIWELQCLMIVLKEIGRTAPDGDAALNTIETLFVKPPGSQMVPKIMLGLQEDWAALANLSLRMNDLTDGYFKRRAGLTATPRAIDRDYFSPTPFDVEDMRLEDITRVQLSESLPFEVGAEGLTVGMDFYSRDLIGDADDFKKRLQGMADLFPSYLEKNEELLGQLEALAQQDRDLQNQLAQVNVQDKKTPISIHNNIEVVSFQVGLVRRMLITLEINEVANLFRLVLGCSLLTSGGDAPDSNLLQQMQAHRDLLETRLQNLLTERKACAMEDAGLSAQAEAESSAPLQGQAQATLDRQARLAELKIRTPLLEMRLYQCARKRNLLDKCSNLQKPNTRARGASWQYSIAQGERDLHRSFIPFGLDFAEDGSLFCADMENARIRRILPSGGAPSGFGVWGAHPGGLQNPADLIVDAEGALVVTDCKQGRVLKFSASGHFIKQFEEQENRPLGPITGLSLGAQGRVWAADQVNNCIWIWDQDGTLDRAIEADGRFQNPVAVCCLPDGSFVVADKSDDRLKRFNADGTLAKKVSNDTLNCGELYLLAFNEAHGLFASDVWGSRLFQFNADLEPLKVYDSFGKRGGEWSRISGLKIWNDSIYIADMDQSKIHAFALPLSS
ncbi:MAG: hypothetical protein G3M78_06225 [Candidatus Nitrohelix vancouverensis]|uniref:NHL repeat containing protein n=1 Tax=Candidatus Nitrohelix vancouverensis TaxID=2705534 RepID=A0A7T0C1W9_9BACT|nr:MAG: hypothetical protein G3M78_06225 [Candidatus Nitrohelix vancouverensis]